MAEKNTTTKLVIGPARFSYMHVLEPAKIGDSTEAKYSVALLFPKTDSLLKKKIDAAVQAAIEAGKQKFGAKFKVTGKFKMPVRDGDDEKGDDPVYKGMWFLNANSNTRPQIVDKAKNEILDKEEIYSGMYGLASVTFFAFDNSGNIGVATGLNNLMKLRDGEKLSGGSTAEEDFADIDPDDLNFEAPETTTASDDDIDDLG